MSAIRCAELALDERFVGVLGSEQLSFGILTKVGVRVVRVGLYGCLETARGIEFGWQDRISQLGWDPGPRLIVSCEHDVDSIELRPWVRSDT